MKHIKFRISRWEKTLIFQIENTDTSFWTLMTSTLAPNTYYIATNGLRINISTTASDISTYSTNAITISNKLNITQTIFATDVLRDSASYIIIAAIRELINYVLAGGTITQTCQYCFNRIFPSYDSSEHFCKWINEVNEVWDIRTDKCSHFNQLFSSTERYEYYDI